MPAIPTDAIFASAQARVGEYLTPAVRLGVTGLSRSGKTVFITALVRNLVSGGRLPFFLPEAEGRIVRAYLEPQPDDAVPRFAYEEHLAELARDPPQWPESTRRISQLRVTVEYQSRSTWRRFLGLEKLHIDIVDYPGEWLVDLALLEQKFAAFSEQAIAFANAPSRAAAAAPFLQFLSALDPDAPADEQVAIAGAKLFADYLAAARDIRHAQATSGPGRFLLPGDLAGSPLLTFFPVRTGDRVPPRGSLAALLARRFESYKDKVVRPFFKDHFSRLDRQIVLVDVLGALNGGTPAIEELEQAIDGILAAFRPGGNSWLSLLLGRRIDKVLFAATKADLLPAASHDRLGGVLKHVVERRLAQAARDGAGVSAVALAALRATEEATVTRGGETFPCIRGIPMPGEAAGGKRFDGATAAVIFPGDLPSEAALGNLKPGAVEIVAFRPARFVPIRPDGTARALPHIRLDRVLEFVIADYLP